jgi:prepilin-type N-terminal cleavage/methylation domain-containing protein
MKKYSMLLQSAFTIVELLVVIGIISILAVALLVTLNPADAQRRARDTQRVKDMNTLQAIIENFIGDNRTFGNCNDAVCESNSGSFTTSAPQPCATNWIGENLCDYARTVAVDPLNNQSGRTCYSWNGSAYVSHNDCTFRYRFEYSSGNYELQSLLESKQNTMKAYTDGGNSSNGEDMWLQVFSGSPIITSFTSPSPAGP